MLQAAADLLDGVADMSSIPCHDKYESLNQAVLVIDEDPPSMIANFMADHTFYSNRGVENGSLKTQTRLSRSQEERRLNATIR